MYSTSVHSPTENDLMTSGASLTDRDVRTRVHAEMESDAIKMPMAYRSINEPVSCKNSSYSTVRRQRRPGFN
jgi:hypothetical protein